MIFVTGDCHGTFNKLNSANFPVQRQMTKDDIVIICGDFGAVWSNPEDEQDKYWLDWLEEKNFTTVFCDGNHENFDMLNNNFEVVDFHGGKAHKIRDSIYHLMRGEIFVFEGLKFFVFGGAVSHDIPDGVLSRDDFKNDEDFKRTVKQWERQGKLFRINHETWWKEELPSDEEYENAEKNLASVNYKVDYVISHSAPQSVVNLVYKGEEPNRLTLWFEEIAKKLNFEMWYFGHYHQEVFCIVSYTLLHYAIERII